MRGPDVESGTAYEFRIVHEPGGVIVPLSPKTFGHPLREA